MSPRAPFELGGGDPRRGLSTGALDDAQTSGFPVVASQFARKDRAGLALGAGVALMLGAVTLFAMSANRTAPPPAPAPVAPAPVTPVPVPVTVVTPPTPLPAPVAVPPPPIMAPAPPRFIDPNIAITAAQNRLRAPALILDNSPAGAVVVPAQAGAVSAKPATQGLTPEEQFAQRLGGEDETASATRMISPSTTVAQGTLMTAMLETAIDSDLPGYVRAVVSRDVKSFDGSRVLIPRSSRLIGQYKSGLAVGQTRAYILWTRLIRPDGVSIALGSPATDYSGRNGLGGKVNSHFVKRFGSAILLSVIGAAGQAIGGGNSAVIVSGPQSAVSQDASRNASIPPTVRVNQGQPIRVFTARDLDFSTVSNDP